MSLRLHITLLMIGLINLGAFAQQSGSVKGKISTSDGQPAAFISIGLKGQTQNTLSDDNGNFTLHKIKPGNYTLKASAVGLITQEKNVTVTAGETTNVNLVLTENKEALREVTIEGKKNKYKVSLPSASLRLNEPLLEAPQNIQTVCAAAFNLNSNLPSSVIL